MDIDFSYDNEYKLELWSQKTNYTSFFKSYVD